MKKLFTGLLAAIALAPVGVAQASTSSAYAGGSVFIDAVAYDIFGDSFVPDLDITGLLAVDAGASVVGGTATDSDSESSTLTITNPLDVEVELFLMIDVYAEASTTIDPDELQTSVMFDSNAFVSIDGLSAFASTNGTYSCSNNDPFSPGYNCFGADPSGFEDAFDSPFLTLAPDETLQFTLTANAFALLNTEVAAVPLPTSVLLLGFGVAGLGGMRLARRD